MAPRAKVASLTSMAAAVKDQKKSSTTGLQASIGQAKKDFAAQAHTDSSSSDSASDSDDSGSNSDDELDLEAERKKLNAKTASTAKPVASVNGSKAAPPAISRPATTKTGKPESDSESDSEEESEDSDESESETKAPAKSVAAPAVKAAATKEADSSSSEEESGSEEESESESEEEAVEPKAAAGAKIPTKTTTAAVVAKPSAPPQESSDEDSGSEADSESEEEDDTATGAAITQSNGVSGTAVSRPNWLESSNFTIRKASSSNPGKEVADFLSTAQLEGKQVWYFTAPASLPITVLQELEIDLADAQSGRAILQHGGDAYGIDLETQAVNSQVQLFIPTKAGNQYHGVKRPIDSAVHIRRQVKFGPDGGESSTATDNYAIKPKAVRQQPQGLRPRFTPIGVPRLPAAAAPTLSQSNASSTSGTDSDSDSDDEVADAPSAIVTSLPAATLKRKTAAPGAAAKRHKSNTAVSTPVPSSQVSLGAVRNETPVPPPSSMGASSIPASTPSRTKKEKKPKAAATKAASSAKTQTPVPAPAVPFKKS